MKRFATVFLLVLLLTCVDSLYAQYQLRDEHGVAMPTIWPPDTSTIELKTITVWFKHSVVNQQYLCDYWAQDNFRSKKSPGARITSVATGLMPINSSLITNSALVATLHALGADSMIQYTDMSPCEDTLSFTRYGDTIRTPEFWNSFCVLLHSPNALYAAYLLDYLYGGSAIEFAQPNPRYAYDGVPYTPGLSPNDTLWQAKTEINFFPSTPAPPTQPYPYASDIVDAWTIQKGDRSIRVGVIDDGVDFNHPDFGAPINAKNHDGIGCSTCTFVDGAEYYVDFFGTVKSQPPSITSGYPGIHGTEVSGLIGATNNNELYVASIAGQWADEPHPCNGCLSRGVSMYILKAEEQAPRFWDVSHFNGIIDAVAKTSSPTDSNRHFAVHVINLSWGTLDHDATTVVEGVYDEQMRRAIDYAYRMGVTCVASKGNEDTLNVHYPSDFEYSKVIAVGSSWAIRDSANPSLYVPVKSNPSTMGYGLDLLAQGENVSDSTGIILQNETLEDTVFNVLGSLPLRDTTIHRANPFTGTSAAAPQVAGVAALLISENKMLRDSGDTARISQPFFPEDVQGLLCVTAESMTNFNPKISQHDTAGYNWRNGYGLLQGGAALKAMLPPYELHHYTTIGGTPAYDDSLNPFILESLYDSTSAGTLMLRSGNYIALRYSVTKTYSLPTTYDAGPVTSKAAAWGLGEILTKDSSETQLLGWNGSQPLDASANTGVYQKSGYTRVIGHGDANENHNRRDIAFGNPLSGVSLQAFCYKVYDMGMHPIANPNYKHDPAYPDSNWYPCLPDSLIFNFSVWGAPRPTGVRETRNIIDSPPNTTISVRDEVIQKSGTTKVRVRYMVTQLGPVNISVFDMLGRQITSYNDQLNYIGERSFVLDLKAMPNGAYETIVRSGAAVGKDNFILVR